MLGVSSAKGFPVRVLPVD